MPSPRRTSARSWTAGIAATFACAALAITTIASPAQAKKPPKPHPNGPTLPIQLLSFNDFHGNLEPPSGSGGRVVTGHQLDASGKPVDVTKDVGGAEYLATHLANARKGNPNSVTVAAGDLVGATPLLSAAFYDEPTIEALNAMKLDVSAVGNHEFDQGYKELQRKQNGGCIDDGDGADNKNSCAAGTFAGANFKYLAANVKYEGTDKTLLPAYTIKKFKGAKIGFIGMTLKDTPDIVTAQGVKGLQFDDEVETANKLVPVLRKQGVKAIVVLIHQGGTPGQETWYGPNNTPYKVNPTYDYACEKGGSLGQTSPILPIADKLDPQIDMVVSGHTHQPYVCSMKDPAGQQRLITSASSFGRLYTETNLSYSRRTNDIVRASVKGSNMMVTRDVPKDTAITRLINNYRELVKSIAGKVLGHITADVTRSTNPAGESALGDLIADAQLADPSVVSNGEKPVVAFMNPGGIRADLTYANSPYSEAPGDITYDEAFTVQPFANYLVSLTMTGQDIYDLLTQQVTGANAGFHKVLQVSKGFTYTLTPSGPVDGSVKIKGVAVDKAASYRVVTNNFLQGGGDGFPAFTKGTGVYYGGLDIDAFANYLSSVSPYTPGPVDRISGTQ